MDGITDIKLLSTEEAREHAGTLDASAVYFQNLVAELENAKKEIVANWQGDTTDIADINSRIDMVTLAFRDKVIPSLQQLSGSVIKYADSIDQNAGANVEDGATTIPGGTDPGVTPGTGMGNGTGTGTPDGATPGTTTTPEQAPIENKKTGFWEWHGGNFAEAWTGQNWAEAWDYSGCDKGIDYVVATVDAIVDTAGNVVDAAVDTVGAAVNFVVDGAFELLGWIF